MATVEFPRSARVGRRLEQGFTLLELMIVVAIIGFLVAYAVVAYQESVRKSRRSVAQGCLLEQAQFLERYYTSNLRYTTTADGTALPPLPGCTADVTPFYDFTPEADTATARSFQLRAVPLAAQTEDVCGTLTLTNTGLKGPADPPDCW